MIANMEMKVVLLMLAFVGVLYGFAMLADGGPTYRDDPAGVLAPAGKVAQEQATRA